MQKDLDKQKLKISFGGLTFTAEEPPYVVICRAVEETNTDIDSKLFQISEHFRDFAPNTTFK